MKLTTFDQFNPHDFEDLNTILDLTFKTMDASTKIEDDDGISKIANPNTLCSQLTHCLAATIHQINKLQERVFKLESKNS